MPAESLFLREGILLFPCRAEALEFLEPVLDHDEGHGIDGRFVGQRQTAAMRSKSLLVRFGIESSPPIDL